MLKNLEEQYQLLSKKEQDISYFKEDGVNTNTNDQDSPSINTFTVTKDKKSTYQKILKDLQNETDLSTPIGMSERTGYTLKLDSIESLIQQIYQDLNNYSECLIAIDSGNSVDIKLFPILPSPPKLYPEDVPISTVHLETLIDLNWDITMRKILPFINGINSINKIAILANADYSIVQQCIQHLMYYGCIIIIDIFQFSNIYAPTSDIDLFLRDDSMASECQSYVVTQSIFQNKPFELSSGTPKKPSNVKQKSDNSITNNANKSAVSLAHSKQSKDVVVLPSKAKLFFLYRSLHQGQSVKNWYREHMEALKHIDIRRFISFGVLRGIIYRVNSYPILDSTVLEKSMLNRIKSSDNLTDYDTTDYSDITDQQSEHVMFSKLTVQERDKDEDDEETIALIKSLQNVHHFDALSTEFGWDRRTLQNRISKVGNYNVVSL